MSTRTLCLLWLVLGSLTRLAPAEQNATGPDPQRVEVITDRSHPFTGAEPNAARLKVQGFDLELPAQLETQLGEGLPSDPTVAARVARQRLESLGRQPLATRFANAYAGLLKALDYGIDRYPAVVFDGGESVVYGVTDLDEALGYYRRWRQQGSAR